MMPLKAWSLNRWSNYQMPKPTLQCKMNIKHSNWEDNTKFQYRHCEAMILQLKQIKNFQYSIKVKNMDFKNWV